MSINLKPLRLPQLLEDRKRESLSDSEMDLSSSYYTQNSSTSDIPSPVTPTFSASARGHLRYSSSTSSLDASSQNVVNESPSSPTFVASKSSKRSLPDVQEEPQEPEAEFDMFDDEDHDDLYDCFCDDYHCEHRDPTVVQSAIDLGSEREYDFADGFFSDGEVGSNPRFKKRREVETPFTGIASRLGTKFPSFSRKWRARQASNAGSTVTESQREAAASRAESSRSSSLSDSIRRGDCGMTGESYLPPTPTKSIFDDRDDATVVPIDIVRANSHNDDREEKLATTPLLPPLTRDASANAKQLPVYSPLQSPSVAEACDPFSGATTPIDAVTTPQLGGMPSPPLSTKPSISSFHRINLTRPGHQLGQSDIPPIVMADENDEWSIKLGHANFNILPEPYLPEVFDINACRQLRADWDLARCNYTKHLVRTGEHYGATSKTYKFTEEKWAQTDDLWRKHNDITVQNTMEDSDEAFSTLRHTSLGKPGASNIMTKIPSLNDLRGGGKFPQLGDEDIVGPMVQVAAQLQRNPNKKGRVFKFFAEKFPTSLGRA